MGQKSVSALVVSALFIAYGCTGETPNQTQPPATAAESTIENAAPGDVLPFPEPPSASVTGKTLADSEHQWRRPENHLPADAPNIVILMTDDAGFSNPSTFGGAIQTPTLDRLAASGISYNAFHTTAMCSPRPFSKD